MFSFFSNGNAQYEQLATAFSFKNVGGTMCDILIRIVLLDALHYDLFDFLFYIFICHIIYQTTGNCLNLIAQGDTTLLRWAEVLGSIPMRCIDFWKFNTQSAELHYQTKVYWPRSNGSLGRNTALKTGGCGFNLLYLHWFSGKSLEKSFSF